MEQLSYRTLKNQGYTGYLLDEAPERVLQFGEGNFLRAFVDCFVDQMNEKAGFCGKVVLAQPIAHGLAETINRQQGLYTLLLRGRECGQRVSRKRIISCVSRCLNPYEDYQALLDCAKNPDLRFLVSNTTEAGICFDPTCGYDDIPPASFPAKLTRFLHARYCLGGCGFILLSCELIDHNGAQLRRCVEQYIDLWGLENDFRAWVQRENLFCSTLVDRIVTGYPKGEAESIWGELGYRDELLDAGEVFGAWVIEGPKFIEDELPFAKAGLPVILTENHTPYKQRKVRILNGAHTATVLGAYLAGQDIVRSCMEHHTIRGFMDRAIYNEIIPTLDLPRGELEDFASAVAERFANPYIEHRLLDIALNSTAKWKARVMPSLLEYYARTGVLAPCLTFSFAAYIAFYHGSVRRGEHCLIGLRDGAEYAIRDDDWVLDFYEAHRGGSVEEIVSAVITNQRMWGGALEDLPDFDREVICALERIATVGMVQAMEEQGI